VSSFFKNIPESLPEKSFSAVICCTVSGEHNEKIEAIIQNFKLNDVMSALYGMGIQEISTYRVKGYGRQKGHEEIFRSVKHIVDFTPQDQDKIHCK
jgi:hypothetical protein